MLDASGNNYDNSNEGLVVKKEDFPMTIIYKGKRYILILTKNDKLILNKYEE